MRRYHPMTNYYQDTTKIVVFSHFLAENYLSIISSLNSFGESSRGKEFATHAHQREVSAR